MICMAAVTASKSLSSTCSFMHRTLIKRPGISSPFSTAWRAWVIKNGKYWQALISKVTANSSLNFISLTLSPSTFLRYSSTVINAPLSLCSMSHSRSFTYGEFFFLNLAIRASTLPASLAFRFISSGPPYFSTTANISLTSLFLGFIKKAFISSNLLLSIASLSRISLDMYDTSLLQQILGFEGQMKQRYK